MYFGKNITKLFLGQNTPPQYIIEKTLVVLIVDEERAADVVAVWLIVALISKQLFVLVFILVCIKKL